jgi:hypothetical protein
MAVDVAPAVTGGQDALGAGLVVPVSVAPVLLVRMRQPAVEFGGELVLLVVDVAVRGHARAPGPWCGSVWCYKSAACERAPGCVERGCECRSAMYEGRLGARGDLARGELALVTAMRTVGRGRADRGNHRGNRQAGAAGAGQSLLNGVAAAATAAMTVIDSLTLCRRSSPSAAPGRLG